MVAPTLPAIASAATPNTTFRKWLLIVFLVLLLPLDLQRASSGSRKGY